MKPVKTALASYGMSGMVFHTPFIAADPRFELTAVVERSRDTARTAYPQAERFTGFEQILQRDDIELVVVNTPDATHYQYAEMALKAGKNVVVEKPFVQTLPEAEELIAIAENRGLLLTVFQNRRFDGDFMTVRSLVESGGLGRIVEYYSSFERYRPIIRDSWKERTDGRVGLLYNLGSHAMDQTLVLFGMPRAVWADMDIVRDGGEVCDYYHIVLQYPRLKVHLRGSMLALEPGPAFAVHGEKGSYSVYGVDPQEEVLKCGPGTYDVLAPDWGSRPDEEWGILHTSEKRAKCPTIAGNYGLYYDNIYDVLRRGAAPEVTPAQMIGLMRLLEACYESASSGCAVSL